MRSQGGPSRRGAEGVRACTDVSGAAGRRGAVGMWEAWPDPERRYEPMHARVATFNLGEGVDETINQVRGEVESGNRPPGLEEAKGVMMLVDRSSGKSIGITFFDDE